MSLNQKLKFSWGHIIAVVAMIFISYATFMGVTYYTDGNFIFAGIGVLAVDLLIILFFIVPQMLKGTDRKFARRIVIERILFFMAPVVFIGAMLPLDHFWTVFEKRSDVETTFSESLTACKDIFTSYEEYANERIRNFDAKCKSEKKTPIAHANAVEALRLQLLDDNYTNLMDSAIEWIDNSADATVWNVFIIGNIKQIETSIETWESSLNGFSEKFMNNEADSLISFSAAVPSVEEAKADLDNLRMVYRTWEFPNMIAIGTTLLLYILLMFPYVLQRRSTRSTYKLLCSKGSSSVSHETDNDESPRGKTDYGSFSL
jgi:hypothetical protein